jgi:hypothetical protein
MRQLILFVALLCIVGALYATPLSESFSGNAFPPAGWSVINGGDANTWFRLSHVQAHTSVCAAIDYSTSAHNDWLISPQLSPSTGDATFSFWAANVNSSYLDRYNVKLSTTSNNMEDFTVTLAANIAPAYNWAQYSYSLSAYAGQTVYVAIQAISTDMGRLLIDDVTGPAKTGFEGFETNSFSYLSWTNSSVSPWTIQNSDFVYGSYAAKSGAIGNNESTSITLTQAGLLAGNINFYQKLSSEAYGDYLDFYIDDVWQDGWSGELGWTLRSYPVTAGTHTFRWTYVKNPGNSAGSDCAWIDEIYLPPVIYGSELNPYLIYNFDQLNTVRNFAGSAYTGNYFKLMSDIDASPTQTTSWVPIGNSTNYFYGNFDGNNHTISNLRCSTYGTYHGLFGFTGPGSTIKNLNLSSTCYILGDGSTGSIVGHNRGSVQNCSSAAMVNIGNADIGGGIVGSLNAGTVSNCNYTGTITRSGGGVTCNKLGGIAGQIETGTTIENCFFGGTVSGNTWCGGIVGWNNGTITRCRSAGTISGASNTQGGLVGQNNGSISNSYARATVSGAQYVGGLVGYNGGSSSTVNCYSTGTVTGSIKGGLIGATGGTVTNSFWDTQTSGLATSYGGTGKTTEQMKTQSTYTSWDFTYETANGTNNYWTMWPSDNDGYPQLYWVHANEFRTPSLTYPANMASGLPVSGFNLTWEPNPAGQAPVSYTLYMVRDDEDHLFDPAFASQHTFAGLTTTSFNPVTTGGITFHQGELWYWAIVAYNATGTATPPSGIRIFITERDPFSTESFEVGNFEGSQNLFDWTQPSGYLLRQWQANHTQTAYNCSPRTGEWNLIMYYAMEYYANGWLFHPYPLVGGVTYDVELYARQNTEMYGNALIGLFFGNSPSIDAMTTEITPPYYVSVVNGDYQRITASFTPETTGTYYLGIMNRVAGLIYYMCIDDVTVRPRALPNPVTLVSPANLATGQPLNPVLTWTPSPSGGLVDSYKIYLQASTTPITPTTLLANVPVGSNTYTLPDSLLSNTTYYWMVVPNNALGDATGNTVFSFSTRSRTLLNEDFGSGEDVFPPTNWTSYYSDESGQLHPSAIAWTATHWMNAPTTPQNSAACVNIYSNRKKWLVSPPLLLSGGAYQLQFDLALTLWSSFEPITSHPYGTTGIDDRFVVYIGDGTSWTTATALREWNNTGSAYVYNDIPNTGRHVMIPLSGHTGTVYIAFYGESTASNADNDLFVDNVQVSLPLSHDLSILSPYGPDSGLIGTPVTHTVTVVNCGLTNETGYTVHLKSTNPPATLLSLDITAPLASGAIAVHNLTWTPTTIGDDLGLYAEVVSATDDDPANNSTGKIAFFSHVAGALLESFESDMPENWTALSLDGVTDCWITYPAFSHSGNSTALVIGNYDSPNDDWLITPPLQLSASITDSLSFWISCYEPAYPESWEVLVSTTDLQPASFTMIDSGVTASDIYERKAYSLDSYGDAVVYFAIRYCSIIGVALFVDDVHGPVVYVLTSLATPVLTVTTTAGNIRLDWNAIPGATEYHVFASDSPYEWPTNNTVVPAPNHSYTFDAASTHSKFFRVTAYAGRGSSDVSTTVSTKTESRLEVLKAQVKTRLDK